MTEVNLVKRFYILVLIILALGGVSACTRDKPADPTPTLPPRTVVAVSSASAASSASTTVVAPASPVIATVEITSTPVIIIPPSATPPPTPTQSPLPGTSNAPGTYTVKWGDWLNKIAAENGVTVQAILTANPGLNPNLIYPGQTINIPVPGGASSSSSVSSSSASTISPPPSNPSTHTVQRGEWIYAIARRFGVSVPALLAANPGVNPNFLVPGQVLNIPGAGSSSSASSTTPPGSGSTYTIKPGDTLFSIAVKFRTTTYALQIKNNLANPHFIYPGQVLQIP